MTEAPDSGTIGISVWQFLNDCDWRRWDLRLQVIVGGLRLVRFEHVDGDCEWDEH
jgi:hypothetical protein